MKIGNQGKPKMSKGHCPRKLWREVKKKKM